MNNITNLICTKDNFTLKVQENFWRKVYIDTPDKCWLWHASINSYGYGNFYFKYKHYTSSRFAYMLYHDKYLSIDTSILHTCDIPLCCNPMHLKEGSAKENTQDALAKGRLGHTPNNDIYVKGVNAKNSILNTEQVVDIKKKLAFTSIAAISRLYNVTPKVIWNIKAGKTYTDVV